MTAVRPILWFLISWVAWIGCGDNAPGQLALDPASVTLMVGEEAVIDARRGGAVAEGATWTSSDEAIARVVADDGGAATVRGVGPGTATITATLGGASATARVTVVSATLVGLAITPPSPTLAAGTQAQLTATGTFSDGTTADLTAMAAWSSARTAVATVDATGKLTGVTAGTAAITARVGEITAMVTATVTAAELVAIEVTPPAPSLARGTTVQLTATGRFTDNTTQDLTAQVTWGSATQAVATVTPGGLVTATNVGTSVVTAEIGVVVGAVTVTVTPALLVAIDVTPTNPSIARGLTQQFTATGRFTDTTTQDLTSMVTWSSATPGTATISNTAGSQGLATGVNVGAAVITATSGAISGSTTLTVTAATLVSIQVTPTNPSVALGLTRQLTATGTFSDASTQDLTASVTWTSGTPAVATVSNAAGSQGLATSASAGMAVITATSGAISGGTTLTVTAATLVSIQVTPVGPSIARGLTQQLTATGTFSDASTQDLTASVTWTSGTPAIATISNAAGSRGLATSTNVGATLITATSGAISGSTTLTVTAATLASIQVTPVNPSIALGLGQQLTATGTFTDATTADLTASVTWTSGTPAVATVSNAAGSEGLATSVGTGTTTITATSGAISGGTTLTVTAASLASIQVTPVSPSIARGLTQQFTATGTFSDATTQDLTASVTWSSSATGTATVSNAAGAQGLATGVDVGTATITATSGAISGATVLTVTPAVLVSIAVTPAGPTLPVGATVQLTATGTFTDATTADLTATVTWASSDDATVQVSNAAGSQGQATAVAAGTATISATSGAISGSTIVTVSSATLVSIAVTPAGASIANGLSQQYTAIGTYSDTTTLDLTATVTWGSSDLAVAQISNAAGSHGLAVSTGVGTTTISATLGAVTGSTTLTVTAAVLVAIAVTPADASLPRGRTLQYTATGTFSDASTQDVTAAVTWASSAPAIAAISNAAGSEGLATAVDLGTATISATLGAISGATTLTVTPAELVSIAVTPAAPTVDVGATVQLTATGTFSDATTANLTATVAWSSAAPAIATVNAAGLVTGVAAGSAQINATAGAIVGSATVTVVEPAPAVVSTSPANAAAGASPLTPIAVTFSRPMAPASLVTQASAGACTGTIQVSLDDFASCIGLGAVAMSVGNTVATTTPSPALAFGTTYKIRVTTGAQSAAGVALAATFTHATGFTTRTDAPCATGLVISQVYGGGGNAGATFRNDFIELHNPTSAPINLAGHAVQYAAAAGPTWQVTALTSMTLAPGAFYLVQGATGGAIGALLPTADATGTINMSATAGKVALTSSMTPLSGTCPTSAAIVDRIGYGATANCSEGTPAPGPSSNNQQSAQRGNSGCSDAGNNSTDFTVGLPVPRNSAPANVALCACTVNETNSGNELDFCNLQHPPTTTAAAGMLTELLYGRVFEAGVTEAGGPNATVRAELGFGPVTANPQNQPGWTWGPASYNVQTGNDDEYQLSITAPATPGTYRYASRFSLDGRHWTYCDLDGAGSNAGLGFDPARLGTLTVTP